MVDNAAGMMSRLVVPGLISLLLTLPLGNARSQTAPTESQPQLSFRSLPALRQAPGNATQGDSRRLALLPLSAFHIPRELLWQTPAAEGAGQQATGARTAPAEATQAIREAIGQSLASLKAGDAAGYIAVLAPDYEQVGPSGTIQNKADVLRATRADLAGHSYAEAEFEITDLRLVTPTEAAVTMTQRVVTVTKDTPPTVYPTGDGSSFVQNNTVTVHRSTVFHQLWVKRGAAWLLVRSQAVDGVTTAVA